MASCMTVPVLYQYVCSLLDNSNNFFLASGGGSPLYPEILQYYTMILQRIRIIVVDAGFEPETSAPEVLSALIKA